MKSEQEIRSAIKEAVAASLQHRPRHDYELGFVNGKLSALLFVLEADSVPLHVVHEGELDRLDLLSWLLERADSVCR